MGDMASDLRLAAGSGALAKNWAPTLEEAATLIEQQAEMLRECLSFVARIEAAGHLSHEGQNFERWKVTARELAPLLRAKLATQSPPDEGE